ncbi:MAG: HAD-IA family hydrolase [Planctomycetota bacterium]
MSRPDALLIDFGGTLALERVSRASIYRDAALRLGCDVTEPRMAELMGESHRALPADEPMRYTRAWFERFIERIFGAELGLGAEDVSAARSELFARFADPATFRVYTDARALLDAARAADVPVAIVSNWTDTLDTLVASLELGPFAAIASSASLGVEKPDAGIFEWALERIGVAPDRALHVGDSWPNDVVGARALGIEAVMLERVGGEGRGIDTLEALVPRFAGPGGGPAGQSSS